MENDISKLGTLDFVDLENRYGIDNARAILRTLEQFEGIAETGAKLSYEDRLRNVFEAMKSNIRFMTRH